MKELDFGEPHPKQVEILNAIFSEDYTNIVLDCGRQFGKSYVLKVAVVVFANYEVCKILYVTPSISQSEKVYNELVKGLENTGLIKSNKAKSGQAEINFVNGSQVIFRSTAQGDKLRGESINYTFLDEAAEMPYSVVNKVIKPMGTVTGKKTIIASTPKGKNHFYNWYLRGQSKAKEDNKWISFKYTSYDNPFANLDNIADAKLELTDGDFRQEYLAEFISEGSVFKNIDELSSLTPLDKPLENEKQDYYAGLDIGLINDSSVLSVVNSKGDLVQYYRFTQLSSLKLIEEIIRINSIWNFKKIMVEINNQGLPIYEQLEKTLTNLVQFTTSSSTKGTIINNLIYLFNSKNIRLMKDDEKPYMQNELGTFIYTQSATGYTRYSGAGGSHDDCVMSLALAIECLRNYRFNEMHCTIFF